MRAKLIFLEVFTRDTNVSQSFYGALFGVHAFAHLPADRVKTYQMPISSDGIDLHVTEQINQQPPRIVPYFAVDNLRGSIEELTALGGKLIVEPFPANVPKEYFEKFREKASRTLNRVDPEANITDKLGEVALMLDPDGNPVGLMQPERFVDYAYAWGKFRKPLTEEQLEDHMTALSLSRELLYEEKGGRKKAG